MPGGTYRARRVEALGVCMSERMFCCDVDVRDIDGKVQGSALVAIG